MTNVVVRGRAQTGRWVDGDVWQQFSFWKTLFAHRNESCAGGATRCLSGELPLLLGLIPLPTLPCQRGGQKGKVNVY